MAWPGVVSPNLTAFRLNFAEQLKEEYKKKAIELADIIEEIKWKSAKDELAEFCKNNRLLPPFSLYDREENHDYLYVIVKDHVTFLNSALRFYIRRPVDGKYRCKMFVDPTKLVFWLVPIRGTKNLLVVRFEPEDKKQFDISSPYLENFANEHGITYFPRAHNYSPE
jgi:hypothetical protein